MPDTFWRFSTAFNVSMKQDNGSTTSASPTFSPASTTSTHNSSRPPHRDAGRRLAEGVIGHLARSSPPDMSGQDLGCDRAICAAAIGSSPVTERWISGTSRSWSAPAAAITLRASIMGEEEGPGARCADGSGSRSPRHWIRVRTLCVRPVGTLRWPHWPVAAWCGALPGWTEGPDLRCCRGLADAGSFRLDDLPGFDVTGHL
jgi:hypothetical protein